MSFATPPPPSTGFSIKDHLGSLVLIEVLGTQQGLITSNGPADVIRANVTVLDGGGLAEQYDDTLLFGKVIYSQLKSCVGGKILGRIAQGNAKPGQTAPWILNPAEAQDVAKAEAWVAQNARPAVVSAEPPF